MKKKYLIFTLLALALIFAACAPQESTTEPAGATSDASVATEASPATEATGEVAMPTTGAAEGGVTAEGAEATATTPAVSGEAATAAPGAGGTAGVPQTGLGDAGLPDNLQDVITILQAAGSTVEVGDEVQQDFVTATGRIVLIDGQEVRFFTYPSAEELSVQVSQLSGTGDPENAPRYYKLGNMLVFYAGRNPGVRDLLEDVLGAQEAAP